jgi:predicted AlkP superfamily phosphohydrolase/phosphomutase
MTQDKKQVLAVGIEVGNYGLVRDWISRGFLPVLQSLSERGSLCPMSTVTEISSGSIWPSFSTGTNPLRNGQFFTHMQLAGGSYKIDKKYASDVQGDPFWALLAQCGRRVFSFDVAQTRPIKGFNGINLCAWGSEYPAWPRSSWPEPLMKELVSRHGSHPLVNSYRLSISPESEEEYEAFYRQLTTGLQRKGEICVDVLARESWELALIIFPEVHWAMHLLWQTYDRDHPDYDLDIRLPFDNVFLDLYRKLDAWIGRFIELMPDAEVVVFSGSGLGPNYSGWHLLPEVLDKLGVGPSIPDESRHFLSSLLPMQRWGASKIRKIEDRLSLDVIEFLKKCLPAPIWDKLTRRLLYAGNRWDRSKAFAIPNDYSGAIRINLEGREPDGLVSPGAEYEALCNEIVVELKQLINPDTGRPAVAEVIRLKELYPEDDLGDFPDLIVTWANDAPITSVTSPRVGVVSRAFPERRSGAHRNDCFLISSRRLDPQRTDSGAATLLDIAPTLFELSGVEPARHFDGNSLLA